VIDKRVTFQSDWGSYGEGVVVEYDELTGRTVVLDDDGERWSGFEDHVEIVVEDDS
jgi:hypothetical protein